MWFAGEHDLTNCISPQYTAACTSPQNTAGCTFHPQRLSSIIVFRAEITEHMWLMDLRRVESFINCRRHLKNQRSKIVI